MGHITELISMLGSHMEIVVIGCVEIAAAVALVSTGIARKLRKEKKRIPDPQNSFFCMRSEEARMKAIWLCGTKI